MLETIIILTLAVVDQLVKLWAAGPLRNLYSGDLPLIKGVFHLTYNENRGAAFGMLQSGRTFFIVLTVVAIIALTVLIIKKRRVYSVFTRVGLSLVYAGALGNLIDRVLLGYVRDMFYFRLINFAIFNVADACLTVGSAILILVVITEEIKNAKKTKKNADPAAAGAQAESEPRIGPVPSGEEKAEGGEESSPKEGGPESDALKEETEAMAERDRNSVAEEGHAD